MAATNSPLGVLPEDDKLLNNMNDRACFTLIIVNLRCQLMLMSASAPEKEREGGREILPRPPLIEYNVIDVGFHE